VLYEDRPPENTSFRPASLRTALTTRIKGRRAGTRET
jgi:hypothetical protein